jgi:hypothetical protein
MYSWTEGSDKFWEVICICKGDLVQYCGITKKQAAALTDEEMDTIAEQFGEAMFNGDAWEQCKIVVQEIMERKKKSKAHL